MKIKTPLAFRILKTTFSFYLLVAIVLTAVQMTTEWVKTKNFLNESLYEAGNSAKRGMTLAVWDLDYIQIDEIANGVIALPFVTGLEVRDIKLSKSYGIKGDIEKNYRLKHTAEEDVIYDIGVMKVYSSSKVIFSWVKGTYISIIVNAVIKTLALWLIMLGVGKRLITKPLGTFVKTHNAIDLENLSDACKIDLEDMEPTELKVMETSFNQMLDKLVESKRQLDALNQSLEEKVTERTASLQAALDEITTLKGILPLCCFCKKVRDDAGYWEQVDVYIRKYTQADISHSICPECAQTHYPGIYGSTES